MPTRRIIIVGGGAAGFFAAITCAEAAPATEVILLEKSPHFLSKVRISGGGRCNVTHACFDPREFAARFPRGERALIAPLLRFPASATVAWFESRGAKLKTESDGRMFPTTDSSQTIIDCLMQAAGEARVQLQASRGVVRVAKLGDRFQLELTTGERMECDRLLLATGGCRTAAMGGLAVSLGHSLEPPVPSLFTFQIEVPWLRELAGVSVDPAELSVPGTNLRERRALLITHWGLSGPAVLRLSAWGARALHALSYRFPLRVNWLPLQSGDNLAARFQSQRNSHPAKRIVNTPIEPLPSRLWEALTLAVGIHRESRWADLSSEARHRLVQQLRSTEFPVTGKSMNKEEFVTCGGVRLSEVNFKTMESRRCPGLYFAGELLDIDGITGGFNFQAAWTGGWLAGQAMAEK